MDAVLIREARKDDALFIVEMLLAAVNWDPSRPQVSEALIWQRPELAHYVAGWPRPTDLGVVAEAGARPIGAAWLRRFDAVDPGYGFVEEAVPELTIGVLPAWRGQGVGGRLLDALLDAAHSGGVERVSLSVEPANGAAKLYRSRGFREVSTNGGAVTMVAETAGLVGR